MITLFLFLLFTQSGNLKFIIQIEMYRNKMYCVNWESYPNCLFKFQDFHGIYSGKYMDTEEVMLDLGMDMEVVMDSATDLVCLGYQD